jgi:hypothetical protein
MIATRRFLLVLLVFGGFMAQNCRCLGLLLNVNVGESKKNNIQQQTLSQTSKHAILSLVVAFFGWQNFPETSSAAADAATPFVEDLQCPRSFATQTLGIQNIVSTTTSSGRLDLQKSLLFGIDKKNPAKNNLLCQQTSSENSELPSIVQGVIYLPSSSPTTTTTTMERSEIMDPTATLVITVSNAAQPAVPFFAGAQIPMSQIPRFPISFSLGQNNRIVPKEDTATTTTTTTNNSINNKKTNSQGSTTNKDYYITAKICPSSTNCLPCKDADSVVQGRGISKVLVLPAGGGEDGDEMSVRAAASIRLTQSSTPDTLLPW